MPAQPMAEKKGKTKDDQVVVTVVPVPEDQGAAWSCEAASAYPAAIPMVLGGSAGTIPYSSTTKLPMPTADAPDGGVVAWAQVLASFLLNAVGWGYPATFGVYQLYYVDVLGLPGAQVAWVGSLQTFLTYILCVVAGALADSGRVRTTVAVGAILVVAGTLATSWAVEYWQILLAQGMCTGLGLGLITAPPLTVINSYFNAKRSVAVTTSTIGTSIGSIVFPAVVQLIIPRFGFVWAVRASALVAFLFCALGFGLLRPRAQARPQHPEPDSDAGDQRAPSLPVIDMAALTERPFLCLCASSILFFITIYFALFYITVIAQQVAAMSPTTSVTLLMINSAAGIPTRPLSGWLSDRFPRLLGPMRTYAVSAVLVGVSLLGWIAVTTPAGMYVFAVCFGLTNGAAQGIWPGALISLCPDPRRVGVRFGMACVFVGFATLAGPPMAAAIIDAAGRGGANGFLAAQAWAGALAVVSGLVALGAGTRSSRLVKSDDQAKV